MVKRSNIRFVLFCILALSLCLSVSCAKKTPEPSVTSEGQQGISETEYGEGQKAGQAGQGEAISEQELKAQRRAEEKERQQQRQEAQQARQQFLSEKVYFEFDDSSLTDEAREVLRSKVRWIRAHPDACIIIEGHCDERGTDEYNLALGSRRAESVKDFLVKAGIDASSLTTISYGEERPAVKGHDPEAWAKNRRAEFRFCSGN